MTDREAFYDEKRRRGLISGDYIIKDGQVVCKFCGSNCGQCADGATPGDIPKGYDNWPKPWKLPPIGIRTKPGPLWDKLKRWWRS